MCLSPSTAKIKINGRTFQILKVLGEGGFSFVYLAQDVDSGVSAKSLGYINNLAACQEGALCLGVFPL